MTNNTITSYAQEELIIERVLKAPRDLVFKSFSQLEMLKHWWGPKGLTLENCTMDSGSFHYCMKAPGGVKMWGKLVFKEMISPEKIVFVSSFSDKAGNIIRPPFAENWPLEIQNTLTLTEQDGKTFMTLRGKPINSSEEENNTFSNNKPNMTQGFNGSFEQLENYIASLQNS